MSELKVKHIRKPVAKYIYAREAPGYNNGERLVRHFLNRRECIRCFLTENFNEEIPETEDELKALYAKYNIQTSGYGNMPSWSRKIPEEEQIPDEKGVIWHLESSETWSHNPEIVKEYAILIVDKESGEVVKVENEQKWVTFEDWDGVDPKRFLELTGVTFDVEKDVDIRTLASQEVLTGWGVRKMYGQAAGKQKSVWGRG
ncbi:hypothetical protein BJ508DRAFT_375721 [Ascobolus immersus RN42]|uniref:Uncharacterized protein n=1 Tax=Ascobolus immersus RN42 TaxID=1160509 RepID=A0A3N4IAH0_ASCIM|nr:hypothetical protein BJ508DRAFT_375721 [Ascobolus immersus RN42]